MMVEEPGFVIRRYITDRTVIEDTESSIDLRIAGWRLENYPERLSYSATPPDFGALCVQRQRWANGGLVMLPACSRLLRTRRDEPRRARRRGVPAPQLPRVDLVGELRALAAALLPLRPDAALPLRGADGAALLRRHGDRPPPRRLPPHDVLRLYGLNLLLLPVNTVGTVRSIVQAIGGQKIAFARTPKANRRTIAPLAFVALPFVIVVWSAVTLANDISARRYSHAASRASTPRSRSTRC